MLWDLLVREVRITEVLCDTAQPVQSPFLQSSGNRLMAVVCPARLQGGKWSESEMGGVSGGTAGFAGIKPRMIPVMLSVA